MKKFIFLLMLISVQLYSQDLNVEKILKFVGIDPMTKLQSDKDANHALLEKIKNFEKGVEAIMEKEQGLQDWSNLKINIGMNEFNKISTKYPNTSAALMAQFIKISLFSKYR